MGETTALDVATALLQELSELNGTTAWHRKLVSGASQVHSTLKKIDGVSMGGMGGAKILQVHAALDKALAIVEQHSDFESKFLHAQWEGEISTALRQLWKLHIELLLAVRLQEEVSGPLPTKGGCGELQSFGSDVDVLSSDMGSLDLDHESSEGSC
eukprot:evm.model.scf_89.14 EVM.evm.TU.scf_89.14   scf_89:62518-64947(+)